MTGCENPYSPEWYEREGYTDTVMGLENTAPPPHRDGSPPSAEEVAAFEEGRRIAAKRPLQVTMTGWESSSYPLLSAPGGPTWSTLDALGDYCRLHGVFARVNPHDSTGRLRHDLAFEWPLLHDRNIAPRDQ